MITGTGQPGSRARARGSRAQMSRARRVRQVVLAVVATAGIGAILSAVGVLQEDLATTILVVAVVGAVVTLLTWTFAEHGLRLGTPYWFASTREESVRPATLDYRMLRLRRDLRDALERADREDQIYPVVRQLAAERLRARHQLDLDRQPEEAAVVMHEQLTRYLTRPPKGTEKRSKRDLTRALDRIEEL